ncbi:MAG: cupin domain-containing protein [Methylococcaceae bacterium]|nr:cupin domain-containing protein [Methylococcaceae bacterium]
MPLIEASVARQFAETWIDAWNRHDLEAVLAHYADDAEFSSPLIVEFIGEPGGTLKGKPAIRAYWAKGLERIPELRFQLLDVLPGIDQVTLYYRGHRGMVAECCQFDGMGQVVRASASYSLRGSGGPLVPPALDPASVSPRTGSTYPTEELRHRVAGRSKRAMGDALGLQNFGVNLVTLEPGAVSALRHWHTRQDEFIYVLEGELTLVTEQGEQVLAPGHCAGFPAGTADGHQLVNRSAGTTTYLEAGDRLPGDRAHYPDEDLLAIDRPVGYGFFHKDGSPY